MPLHHVVVIPSVVAQEGKRIRGNDWIRFWSKVDRSGGPTACWPWTSPTNSGGYGQFTIKIADGTFKAPIAHRWLLEQLLGRKLSPDPGVEDACHSCNNRACCNPLHLYVDNRSGNVKYAVTSERHFQSSKTHCPANHGYTEENTYLTPDGDRRCRACRREQGRAATAAAKAAMTHCKNQHELSGGNVKIVKGGRRKCVKCEAARTEKFLAIMREKRASPGSA